MDCEDGDLCVCLGRKRRSATKHEATEKIPCRRYSRKRQKSNSTLSSVSLPSLPHGFDLEMSRAVVRETRHRRKRNHSTDTSQTVSHSVDSSRSESNVKGRKRHKKISKKNTKECDNCTDVDLKTNHTQLNYHTNSDKSRNNSNEQTDVSNDNCSSNNLAIQQKSASDNSSDIASTSSDLISPDVEKCNIGLMDVSDSQLTSFDDDDDDDDEDLPDMRKMFTPSPAKSNTGRIVYYMVIHMILVDEKMKLKEIQNNIRQKEFFKRIPELSICR